ncbi:MAG: cytochrome P450 [Pseudomonadota bacterium]
MTIPESDIDLFSDTTLTNTAETYRTLRGIGPVVHLTKNNLYAITTFEAVRHALRADSVLVSGRGVAANELINQENGFATIVSDGDTHRRRRSVLVRPLTPKALADLRDQIEETADAVVRDLVARDGFDGVTDFASHLPMSIVADLVGLDAYGKERMLTWAAATFDVLGPMNMRAEKALETSASLLDYVRSLNPAQLQDGGWAQRVFGEIETGKLSPPEAAMMVVDYTAPALDTTILASAEMLWRLGSTDGAFARIKSDPDLIPGVINESVRLASPIRAFTRYAESDYETAAGMIPAGSRVAVLYASANRDGAQYDRPDEFLVGRNPRDHVGWGHGAHTCAGMHLARLEMESLLRAMVAHVDRIEVDTPERIMNNLLQGYASFSARFA